MNATELHVYVSCTAPDVMTVFFCTAEQLTDEAVPSQDELAEEVIQRLDTEAFERAVLANDDPLSFASHVGVVRVSESDIEYHLQTKPSEALEAQKPIA